MSSTMISTRGASPAVGLRVAATTGDQEHQGETEPDY
jgi:hypothetical protein